MTHDYTRKRGVVHTEILLPPHAPPSFSDRAALWNSVELYEKAGNAQLAREIDAALPIELSRVEQIRLVREYCSSQFVSRGMCVDFAIHDTDSGNPHCHIMLPDHILEWVCILLRPFCSSMAANLFCKIGWIRMVEK